MPRLADNSSTIAPLSGLVQSLTVKRQRTLLDDIGRALHTPVVYVKAAWADPVLFYGRGERVGTDIDLLVHPARFEAFAAELVRAGYTRATFDHHLATNDAFRAWVFHAPEGFLTLDLHRALANEPWFELRTTDLLARSALYDSPDGPIRSLHVCDQIVYAAAHYANHVFNLDERHIHDVELLITRFPIDWELVVRRAKAAYLDIALRLLVAVLRSRGVTVPREPFQCDLATRTRMLWLKKFIATESRFERVWPIQSKRWADRFDAVALMPMISTRHAALPKFLGTYVVNRAQDLRRRSAGVG